MAVSGHLGNQAAQQIQLIRSGHRDHQIRVLDVRLHLHGIAGPVAHITHNIILVAKVLHHCFSFINDGDVVSLLAENCRQSLSHLAASHNNNLQCCPSVKHSLIQVL